LRAIVLGSAAGGGVPQWNCRCQVCELAWAGDPRVKRRTQAGIAVSADGREWTLLNASPDLRTQIEATSALHPTALRGSPIQAVVLTGAEVDQTAGLLSLREQGRFSIYGTAKTLRALSANSIFEALAPSLVTRHPMTAGHAFTLPGGLEAEFFAVPGKIPLYLEKEPQLNETSEEGDVTVGIDIRSAGKRIVFMPGAARITDELRTRAANADILFFDGTVYTDDEMIRSGTGVKTGRRMGHMPISGNDGSLHLHNGSAARRVFMHINNTNPILVEDSVERAAVAAAGWQVAEDGMEFAL
jgi:pyrroloquinoline quinone biosynthesis protein B